MTPIEAFIVMVFAQLVTRLIVWLFTRNKGSGPKLLP